MIKVTIVDDHALLRNGLARILKEEPDMMVISDASGYHELLECLAQEVPDIILLDISMQGKNGLEVLKELKKHYPKVRVIMLSMHPEDRFSVRAIKAGASGYITKESATELLVSAIRKVNNGGKFIPPSVAELLANSFENHNDLPIHELLSDREFQILRLITAGKKVKEIATDLFISPSTVATYRYRILHKTFMKSNVELTNYALRHDLLD